MYAGEMGDGKRVLLEMLHSCTPDANKEAVLRAFKEHLSELRVLVATITFSMGVDSRGVYRVIRFGPSKNVETSRGGRDGKQTVAHIIYQGLLLNHVERDIKQYVKSEECRRKTLMCQFDNCKHVNCLDPKHCDNCAKNCYCNCNVSRKLTMFPGCANQTGQNPPSTDRTRIISMQQKKAVFSKLSSYYRYLVHELISKSPGGQLPTLTNLQFMLGFSNQQIYQVLENCSKIFTLEDVISNVEIWHKQHALKIMASISSIFVDCGTEITMSENIEDEEEESDTWLGDRDRLMDDKELFQLAVENITMSSLDDSENDSLDNSVDTRNIPLAVVSALENLRLF